MTTPITSTDSTNSGTIGTVRIEHTVDISSRLVQLVTGTVDRDCLVPEIFVEPTDTDGIQGFFQDFM